MAAEQSPVPMGTAEEIDRSLLTHRRLLGARLYLHTWVRLLAAVMIVVGALIARHVVGISELDVQSLVRLALVVASYNAVAWSLARHYRTPERSAQRNRFLQNLMYATIVMDYLALTVAIWVLGGSRSPFLSFYLLHVILSSVLISRGRALLCLLLAYLLMSGLVLGEWAGVIPSKAPIGAIAGPCELDGRYTTTVLTVYTLLFGMAGALLIPLTSMLRTGEGQLHRAMAELTRLSNMRRDFLHIAMHNLQSPVGVVTMFLKNMRSGLGGPVSTQQDVWLQRSLGRLEGLSAFLHDLQVLSALESVELDEAVGEVDLGEILESLVAEHQDEAQARRHQLTLTLEQELPPVKGIDRLLREALANYLTNAMKYTPDGGHISVRARADGDRVRVEVADDGIGISASDQKRLFQEFVRVGRDDPVAAQEKGSGLGLSIVKRVIDAHGGSVGVTSELRRGSVFWIELPRRRPRPERDED